MQGWKGRLVRVKKWKQDSVCLAALLLSKRPTTSVRQWTLASCVLPPL